MSLIRVLAPNINPSLDRRILPVTHRRSLMCTHSCTILTTLPETALEGRADRILHLVVGTLVIQLSGYDSDDLLQRSARKLRRYGMPSKSHSCTHWRHPVIHALIRQRSTSY
jgi:hypothetical protein